MKTNKQIKNKNNVFILAHHATLFIPSITLIHKSAISFHPCPKLAAPNKSCGYTSDRSGEKAMQPGLGHDMSDELVVSTLEYVSNQQRKKSGQKQ